MSPSVFLFCCCYCFCLFVFAFTGNWKTENVTGIAKKEMEFELFLDNLKRNVVKKYLYFGQIHPPNSIFVSMKY